MVQAKLKMALLRKREAQYELAARVGISETRLSRIVQGRAEPTEVERKSIANALGMPEADLFSTETTSRKHGVSR
jgi:transcriptional regulator with XRE-family HTH domain